MQVQVRLGSGLAKAARSPRLKVELPPEATVAVLLERVGELEPAIATALASALPVVGGTQVSRGRELAEGDEVALLIPVAGGAPAEPFNRRRWSWP